MQDHADQSAQDFFQVKRRGRPVTGSAKTDAERMRAYRIRKKQSALQLTVTQPAATANAADQFSIDFWKSEVHRLTELLNAANRDIDKGRQYNLYLEQQNFRLLGRIRVLNSRLPSERQIEC